jgi:ABC-type transport system involved in multi-copper enzyme maturation permease subunit
MKFAGARAVFERDFLVETSRVRFLVLRTLVVLVPAAILLTVLGTNSTFAGGGTSRLGILVYVTSMVIVPALVLLLAPVLAASSISSERAMNTLQIVLASPVSPFAFVFAKFASRLAIVLVLIFATLPLAGICFLYGGISAGLYFELVSFAMGVAVLGTAAGIVASSYARNVATAVMASYFMVIICPLLHLAAIGIAHEAFDLANPFDDPILGIKANPYYVWSQVTPFGPTGAIAGSAPGWTFLAFMCVVAGAALWIAARRIGRESASEAVARRTGQRVTGLRYENPVLDRGLRGSLLHKPRWAAWTRFAFVLLVLAVMLTLGAANRDLNDSWPHIAFLCITTAFLSIAAMTTAAHTIASERESGALDMLLATPLTTADVIRGKFYASVLSLAPLVAIALFYGVFAACVTRVNGITVLAWLASVGVLIPFFTAIGMWCSAGASTAGRAVLRAFALLIGGSVLHGVACGITVAVAHRILDDDVMWYIGGASPFFVGGTAVGLSEANHMGNDGMHAFVSWIIWCGIYVFATVWLLNATGRLVQKRNEAR